MTAMTTIIIEQIATFDATVRATFRREIAEGRDLAEIVAECQEAYPDCGTDDEWADALRRHL